MESKTQPGRSAAAAAPLTNSLRQPAHRWSPRRHAPTAQVGATRRLCRPGDEAARARPRPAAGLWALRPDRPALSSSCDHLWAGWRSDVRQWGGRRRRPLRAASSTPFWPAASPTPRATWCGRHGGGAGGGPAQRLSVHQRPPHDHAARHVGEPGGATEEEAAAIWVGVTAAVRRRSRWPTRPDGLNMGQSRCGGGAGIPGHFHIHVSAPVGGRHQTS